MTPSIRRALRRQRLALRGSLRIVAHDRPEKLALDPELERAILRPTSARALAFRYCGELVAVLCAVGAGVIAWCCQ